MCMLKMSKYKPLANHQTGIKIKNIILEELAKNDEFIVLDFKDIDICTDSFAQQLTTILSEEIGFQTFRKRVKFINLNDFIKDLIKSKLQEASKQVA